MSSTTTVTEAPTIVTVTQQPEITAENVLRLFPEVNTDLIGGSHNSATSDDALTGYDEEQIRLMDEVCIVLDNNDVPIGSATKKLCEYSQAEAAHCALEILAYSDHIQVILWRT
jgi:isopentenyl-diphosphate delta-isomerase